MVVSFLASGSIGVASCPPLCSFRPLEQPPLSAASPRELIYNAHLGNTKGLLSSLRFNAFSPKSPRCPFYTLFRRRHPFPQRSFLFPRSPHVFPFLRRRFRDTLSPSIRSSLFFFFCHVESYSPQNNTDKLNRVIFLYSFIFSYSIIIS